MAYKLKLSVTSKIASAFLLSSSCWITDKIVFLVFCVLVLCFILTEAKNKIIRMSLPLLLFSLFVLFVSSVSFSADKGLFFIIDYKLSVRIFVSSFFGFLLISSVDTVSLVKGISFYFSRIPLVNRIGIDIIAGFLPVNLSNIVLMWKEKVKAVKSRSGRLCVLMLIPFAYAVLISVFRKSEETAMALESRNFIGVISSEKEKISYVDVFCVIACLIVFCAAVIISM